MGGMRPPRALCSLLSLFHLSSPAFTDILDILVLAELSPTNMLGALGSLLIFHCHASKLFPGGAVKL